MWCIMKKMVPSVCVAWEKKVEEDILKSQKTEMNQPSGVVEETEPPCWVNTRPSKFTGRQRPGVNANCGRENTVPRRLTVVGRARSLRSFEKESHGVQQ